MSVLIKDMEKPKYCYAVIDGESEYCPFVNTDDDCVILLKKGICEGTWADQYSKCPLIELPPHGRLIDADALLEESEWVGERATYDNPMPKGEEMVSVENILNAPTFIEAEVKE